jgi:hypothetical protein
MERIHPVQAMLDGMSAQLQKERSTTQMTLGKMIAALEAMVTDKQVQRLAHLHSYRGYYSDLAFELRDGTMSAQELTGLCRAAMFRVYQGYKGGDYLMGENTPMWISDYGSTGLKLMGFAADGSLETQADD